MKAGHAGSAARSFSTMEAAWDSGNNESVQPCTSKTGVSFLVAMSEAISPSW